MVELLAAVARFLSTKLVVAVMLERRRQGDTCRAVRYRFFVSLMYLLGLCVGLNTVLWPYPELPYRKIYLLCDLLTLIVALFLFYLWWDAFFNTSAPFSGTFGLVACVAPPLRFDSDF